MAALAVAEQLRAGDLRERGDLKWLADDPDCPDLLRLSALMEEVGEVAWCLQDGLTAGMRAELIHVAGIAIAWASVA